MIWPLAALAAIVLALVIAYLHSGEWLEEYDDWLARASEEDEG